MLHLEFHFWKHMKIEDKLEEHVYKNGFDSETKVVFLILEASFKLLNYIHIFYLQKNKQ